MTPQRSGRYTAVKFEEQQEFYYAREGVTPENVGNRFASLLQTVTSPPRLAGSILLVHETLDQVREPRQAWRYNPGQRRVRRAPNIAYDNPGTASDGLRTIDNFDLFVGAPDRYTWEFVGKKERYVPYNAYKLHSDQLKLEDLVIPGHLNQDHTRYELHRVWVVEARLKEGFSHIYSRRTLYFDEDSWVILLADHYDGRGQLWRVAEGHTINFYDVPATTYTVEALYEKELVRATYWRDDYAGWLNGTTRVIAGGSGGFPPLYNPICIAGPQMNKKIMRKLISMAPLSDEQRDYLEHKGAYDPHERIKEMDLMGIDQVLVIPTMVIANLPFAENAEGVAAFCRAYNNWLVDWCAAVPNRLFGAALLPLQSPELAAAEVYRIAELGHPVGLIRPIDARGMYPNDIGRGAGIRMAMGGGSPSMDAVFRALEETGVCLGMHTFPGGRPQ